MHGLIRALPSTLALSLVVHGAGCTSAGGNETTTDEGSTETGDIEPGPICAGEAPGPDIVINSPDDLDAIIGIECIPGKLLVDDSVLDFPDLQGLETLREIGCFEIRSNRTLVSLTGLENVWRIGNPEISNCGFKVLGTKSLPNLAQLESLSYVNVPITINYNDAMTDVAGLEHLTDATTITIESNPLLTSFIGLSGLESVGKLVITDNDALTDMTGFPALEEIRGELHIEESDGLTSLDGFTLLQTIGDTIWISSNPNLPTCTAQEFVDGIANKGGAAQIYKNQADSCGD